jgi:hypothetical protein
MFGGTFVLPCLQAASVTSLTALTFIPRTTCTVDRFHSLATSVIRHFSLRRHTFITTKNVYKEDLKFNRSVSYFMRKFLYEKPFWRKIKKSDVGKNKAGFAVHVVDTNKIILHQQNLVQS